MRLSFVIPSLNQGKFIGRCLKSCAAQAVKSSEIVVQDGGSRDSTVVALEEFSSSSDSGPEVSWVSESDDGQSSAVNRAIVRARGEVIAWINADDYYANNRVLHRVLETFADPHVDVVYGNATMVSVNGDLLRRYPTPSVDNLQTALMRWPSSPLSQPATFFRRSIFVECGQLRVDCHWAPDFELWLRLIPLARQIRKIDACLACMTVHKDAKSSRGLKQQNWEVTDLKLQHLKRNDGSLTDYLRVYRCLAQLEAYRYYRKLFESL